MIILTPRIYKQSMQWKIDPSNKIDTVTANPILNTVASDPSKFYTSEALPVKLLDTQTVLSLPIADSLQPTHFRTVCNSYKSGSINPKNYDWAKARTEVVMAYGEKEITLQTPVDGIPSATLLLEGETSVVDRGSIGFNDYPSISNLKNKQFSLASWIEQNRSRKLDNSLSWDYSDGSFSTNPWVRRIYTYAGDIYNVPANIQPPEGLTANDVVTMWYKQRTSGGIIGTTSWSGAHAWAWSEESSYRLSSSEPVFAWQNPNPSYWFDNKFMSNNFLKITDDRFSFGVTIDKIDNYKYRLKYTAPVRFAYAAAAKIKQMDGVFDKPEDEVDSWGFVDRITSVKAVFIGKPYNTDDVTISYSFDNNKGITENTKNVNVSKIDKSEFITMSSTIAGKPWNEEIAKKLLSKYEKGKYLVTCDVPAKWAIEQGIHPNVQLQVIQQDGTPIARQGNVCTFEVKTIAKSFKDSSFVFTLGLMEV